MTVSGASAEANNFIIDGISDNMEFSGAIGVTPPMDAIQEFAIQDQPVLGPNSAAPAAVW